MNTRELRRLLAQDGDEAYTVTLTRDFGTSLQTARFHVSAKVVPTQNMVEYGYDRVAVVEIRDTTDRTWPVIGRRTYPAPVRRVPAPSGHGFVFRGHARIREYLDVLCREVAAELEATKGGTNDV